MPALNEFPSEFLKIMTGNVFHLTILSPYKNNKDTE